MNLAAVAYIMGMLTAGVGGFMLLPAAVGLWHGDADGPVFAACGTMVLLLGGLLVMMNQDRELELGHREGFLITFLSWTLLSLLAAWPMYATGRIPTMVDAWFEAVSGLTTTGATIMTGLDTAGHGILLWRALLHALGGMGILVLAVAVLPLLGVGRMQLYKSEGASMPKDKLTPRITETARVLWGVYVLLIVLCMLAYRVGGMGWFDAACYAMSTLSTGGFGNYDANFGPFLGNRWLEGACMVFMLAGATNFALHYRFLVRQKPSVYRDPEVASMLLFVAGCSVLGGVVLMVAGTYANPLEGMWAMAFNTISLMSSTGFTALDYEKWPAVLPLVLVMVTYVGGSSGSTSGGIRHLRLLLLYQAGKRAVRLLLHPAGVWSVKYGSVRVPDALVLAVFTYVAAYSLTLMVMSVLVALTGVDVLTSVSTVNATMANAGPALGMAGPSTTYAALPAMAKFLLSWSMLLGRLEIYAVLLIFMPRFWRA